MKKNFVIVSIVVIVLVVGVGIFLFIRFGNSLNTNTTTNSNTSNTAVNENQNVTVNNATNQPSTGNIITDSETTLTGTVFIKGYGTPSESYGILSTDNYEVGLGKYDSMKEQFRAYVGDKITATFSKICRSTDADCCLTVFYYCGTVKEWEPLNTNQ